jgi:hypothetical protein
VAPEKFPQVVEEYAKAADAALKTGDHRIYPMTYGEYFANNLGYAIAYSLFLMEDDPRAESGLCGERAAQILQYGRSPERVFRGDVSDGNRR